MKKEAKKRLYESTVELLKESDYEDLTIGKICHNAGCVEAGILSPLSF